MKIILLIFSSLLLTNFSFAQYIEHHNLMDQANQSWYQKEYKKSLKLFHEGFEKVDYVHSINYTKAARTAAKLEHHPLTKLYLIEAFKRGYPQNLLERDSFKKFKKTAAYNSLVQEIQEYNSSPIFPFNEAYQFKVDSLFFIDQNIIRGNKQVAGFTKDTTLTYHDSLNFKCLLGLIQQYGFPSEQHIGFSGYRKSWVLIHHSARLIKNHYYHPILLDYLKNGEYLPEHYCWVIDQGQELLGLPLIYYHWDVAKNINELTITEKKEIEERRLKVGMASIERIKVVKKSRTNKLKW